MDLLGLVGEHENAEVAGDAEQQNVQECEIATTLALFTDLRWGRWQGYARLGWAVPSRWLLNDLHLSFGDFSVLEGISLDLHRGETLSVLGGSGAGKSTILRLILGLSLPDSGRVRLEGQDIADAPLSQVLALRRNRVKIKK